MRTQMLVSKTVALALVITIAFTTAPVTLARPAAPVGSITAIGAVELRGLPLPREGTVFAGDRIRTDGASYAELSVGFGRQVELGANTDVTLGTDGATLEVALAAGSVAFYSSGLSPLRIKVDPFEVEARSGAAEVTIVGDQTAGIRVRTGSLVVRNSLSGDLVELSEGQERILGRKAGVIAEPVSVVASRLPSVPANSAPRRAPAPQGAAMSSGAWIAIMAAIAGGAAAGSFFLARRDQVDESELAAVSAANDALASQLATLNDQVANLNSQISSLQGNNIALQNQLITIRNAAELEINALETQLRGTEIELATEQTKNAILASSISAEEQATLAAEADSIIAEINDAETQITTINTDISDIKNQLENTSFNEVHAPGHVNPERLPGEGNNHYNLRIRLSERQFDLAQQRLRINNAQDRLVNLQLNPTVQQNTNIQVFNKDKVPDPMLEEDFASISVPIFSN